MKKTQSYVVESITVEGENGEFTRIELEATGGAYVEREGKMVLTEPDCLGMSTITILTDASDTSEFRTRRVVHVSFDFTSRTLSHEAPTLKTELQT